MENIFWLLPVIFMLHELEEILGFRIWIRDNSYVQDKYKFLKIIFNNYLPERFVVIVIEEYILIIIITFVSIYFKIYYLWICTFIVFGIHLLIHIVQSIIIKKYIPALLTSIILLPITILIVSKTLIYYNYPSNLLIGTTIFMFIFMILNLLVCHMLVRKLYRDENKI